MRLFDVYREATVHMHTAERLAIRRCIFVAKTEAQAHEHARAAQAQMPSIVDDDIIAGTPTQVTEQILFQLGRTGAANIVGFFAGRVAILARYARLVIYSANMLFLHCSPHQFDVADV